MILLIIGFIFLIVSIILFYKNNQIKVIKNKQQQQYIEQLNQKVNKLIQRKIELTQFENKQKELLKQQLEDERNSRKKEIDIFIKNEKELAQQFVEKEKQLAQKTVNTAHNNAQEQISEIHTDLQNIRESANQEKKEIQSQLNKLKASLSAGVEARLREQEVKEEKNFYKLHLDDNDLDDVKKLEKLKESFHQPVVLSKLIWSQYFQKQMNELCDRVLGKQVVCGIYKITNLLTEQCYIGQSVNIADRWKQHCKCGLGINASSTNSLYNAMQKDGVWNFTFELLEELKQKTLLNEKERFWIQMYQSDRFGYNATKGVLK